MKLRMRMTIGLLMMVALASMTIACGEPLDKAPINELTPEDKS